MSADYQALLRCALRDRALVGWLLALLVGNLVLVALHSAYFVCLRYGLDAWPRDPAFSLAANFGFAQLFNSVQTVLLIGLLFRLAAQTREALYLALGAVFVIVLLDDALAFNQVLGELLVSALGIVDRPRLKAQSMAEMMVYGLLALPLLAALAAAYLRARPAHRAGGRGFLTLLAVLTFFATVMDLVHLAFIKSFSGSRLLLEVVEEGGEMMAVSLALLLALTLARQLPLVVAPKSLALPAL
jgi:hypothetical protein